MIAVILLGSMAMLISNGQPVIVKDTQTLRFDDWFFRLIFQMSIPNVIFHKLPLDLKFIA